MERGKLGCFHDCLIIVYQCTVNYGKINVNNQHRKSFIERSDVQKVPRASPWKRTDVTSASEMCSRAGSRMLLYMKVLYRMCMKHVDSSKSDLWYKCFQLCRLLCGFLHQGSNSEVFRQNMDKSNLNRDRYELGAISVSENDLPLVKRPKPKEYFTW